MNMQAVILHRNAVDPILIITQGFYSEEIPEPEEPLALDGAMILAFF